MGDFLMATGLYDIRDRGEVSTPNEIEHGRLHCEVSGIQYIDNPDGHGVIPVATYIVTLQARWKRFAQTARMIDNMRAGYCTIEPLGAPPQSGMTH